MPTILGLLLVISLLTIVRIPVAQADDRTTVQVELDLAAPEGSFSTCQTMSLQESGT